MNRFLSLVRRGLVVGAACAAAVSATAGPKIGLLLKGQAPFWSAVEKGARDAAEKGGVELVVKSPINEADVAVQVQYVKMLVEQGVEAIVIAPGSRDALIAPLAEAAAKGVKIVLIDTTLSGEQPHVFVGANQREAGRAAGSLLGSLMADGEAIVFLKHNQTSGATEQRERGAFERLRELHANLVVSGSLYASSEKGVEEARATALLEQHPEAKAVLASGTAGTMAMIKVLRATGRSGKIHFVGFGFNLNPEVVGALEDGTLAGWIAQLPGEVGARGVKAAQALLAGQTVPASVFVDVKVVTKTNLAEPAVQALLQ